MITESEVKDALKAVKYPGYSRDIVSFGMVKGVSINGGTVVVYLILESQNEEVRQKIVDEVYDVLTALPDVSHAQIEVIRKESSSDKGPLPGVKYIVAVASGKGGVGKSTVTANLAIALAKQGYKVGICDCDLYGPSMALMFGTKDQIFMNDKEQIIPVEAHGVRLLSMGLLLDDSSPIVVRGPVATKYIQQFLRQVDWGELDYLLLDLPPGTGDIQLTIVQTVPVSGAVVVTTPQEVALIDARKAISMFDKVQVPVLGLIENMSYFECPSDGVRYYIFGQGGGKEEAERLGKPILAELPIDIDTRKRSDEGHPVALENPADNIISEQFFLASRQIGILLDELYKA